VAAALILTAGAGRAAAQTVMVRHAPPGVSVDLLLNDAVVGTETTNPEGDATLELKLPEPGEMDANIFVDVCEKSRRVLVVDRNKRAPASPLGCERREISGVFWVRRINTLVVDLAGTQPSMLLVRGKYVPPKPVVEGEEEQSAPKRPSPTGFTLFGGSGLSAFRDALQIACGNASGCDGNSGGFGYSFGGTYWITRWLGAEAGYLKPRRVKASGGDVYHFDSNFDVDVFTATAKVGIPAGPVRVYGIGGANFHQSTLAMTQTNDIASQTFNQKTHGWGWTGGGGIEGWVTPKVALYGEVTLSKIKGKAEDGGEGFVDDRLRFLGFGVRILLSR
jgi:opacity protein-like surface antigen